MRKNNIALSLQNIISFLKILTSHLTGVQKILTLCFIILSLTNITLSFQGNFVSALSYQTYQRLDFTFNPTIQLTLSSSELTIPSLTPGASSDSNVINIGVATNTFGGLNLTATVGNSANDTTSLVSHIDNNNPSNNPTFTNLSTTAATLSDLPNNTWGYSYASRDTSTNPDAAWSSYSSYNGLIKYDDTTSTPPTLLDTTGTATSGAVKFKLGAKASTAQLSGTYTNIVNFTATTKVIPTSYTVTFNNGTNATNWPTDISGSTSSDINIPLGSGQNQTTAPTKAGYIFKGWCTAETTNANCTGNVYQANEAYPIESVGETVVINLYAMWGDNCDNKTMLYDLVACRSKGTQIATDLQAAITANNSGVYEYNSSVFGQASDASNNYEIYYYRGILDTEDGLGTYGSDGQADAHPNYVVLLSTNSGSNISNTDTCWRIVRTTGSGGVKMIYNGTWTGITCANATTAAQATTKTFGLKGKSNYSDWYKNINRVGYTFNNGTDIQDITTPTSVDTVFGSNSNYAEVNTENSNIKEYIEKTWFTTISGYEPILETSAGYCNDRSAYSDTTTKTELSEIPPYATSGDMYFGAYGRNINAKSAEKTPSLSCPRGVVDIYTVKGSSTGNSQLAKPAALLTADEVSLAGSGKGGTSQSSSFNANSYLCSGSTFWLLSPRSRYSNGGALGFALYSVSYLEGQNVSLFGNGVRPAISLIHSAAITSGSGTATDPWIISPPEN